MSDDEVRFRYKLASHLGLVNPFILDDLLPYNVLKGWMEYYELEPFMADRLEANLALIAYMMSSFMGGNSKIEEFFISKREVKNLESEIKKCFMV